MKIVFILPYAGLSGGIRVVAVYAEKLQSRGHEVTVISLPARRVPFRQKIKSMLQGKGWPASNLKESYFSNLDIHHKVLEKSRSIEERDVPDADVVIATFWSTAYWVNDLPDSKGVKCYLIQHHEVPPNFYHSRAEGTYHLPFRKIVVSKWLRDIMQESYQDSDCDLVPNAVDLDLFTAGERDKNKRPTFGFMYNKAPSKNIELAIGSLVKAKQEIPDLRVVSFGSMPPDEKLPLPNWVEFHYRPLQSTIPGLYAKCDGWLFTSKQEGFGLPILESMACRTPVIATNAGAAPDLITSENGVILEPDVNAFVNQIKCFCSMPPSQWKAMSDCAFATARAYSWDHATDLFEEALVKAVARSKDISNASNHHTSMTKQ